MHIVLATGIYPPDIGGPATYAKHLRSELQSLGHQVTVVTYGSSPDEEGIYHAAKGGGPLLRYWRYARLLRRYAAAADVIYSFSSVSCSVPVWLARLKKPKRVLRLGGDFFWERYTALGGQLPLADWYQQPVTIRFWRAVMQRILNLSQALVFSTDFQRQLYTGVYSRLPAAIVIENALPQNEPVKHISHQPLRLLTMARLVRFKNLDPLIEAVAGADDVALTIVGDGPCKIELQAATERLNAHQKITFVDVVAGDAKPKLFAAHDVFIVPSLTDISPNAALEAASFGLPVLLSEQNGLSSALQSSMTVRPLLTVAEITQALADIRQQYDQVAATAIESLPKRPWATVAQEHEQYFQSLLATETRR